VADRMPVILGDEVSVDLWLNGPKDTTFSTLLKPFEKPDLVRVRRCTIKFFVDSRLENCLT